MSPSAPTFSLQHTLPRLPIPRLEETCALYLKSLLPLQTPEEHEKSKAIVHDFLQSELSQSLQQRLIDLDRASPTNWLEDNFWLRKAYLEWRDPLMVNSNWYILGQKDKAHPKQLLSNHGIQPSRLFSRFQIKRAAHMIRRGLEYKELIDREALPIDMMKGDVALCMWQNSRIFSVTRVPMYHCDTIVQADPKQVHHIIVLLRDQVYRLKVYRELKKGFWVLLSTDEIEKSLLNLIHHVQTLSDPSPPIPLLTSWQRDKWAVARDHLLTLHPDHRDHLKTIEDALFAVALDDHSSGTAYPAWTKTAFCGHQGLGHGHNRWFDKSITLLIENNGMCAMLGEHSPVDAMIVSRVFDYMLKEPTPGEQSHQFIHPLSVSEPSGSFEHLVFRKDAVLDASLAQAQEEANQVAAFSDSNVLVFEDYGTDWVKQVGRVPPDAFYQMVLQLAYYRAHHHQVTATYETAATRRYLRGRTETIRTLSMETKAFVEAFDAPDTTHQERYELLVKATTAHRLYTQLASDGYGCDRHLFGLRLLNADHPMWVNGKRETVPLHPIFTDPVFAESQHWRLSTSSLHAGIRLMGTGFGTVYHDGYGINYMAAPQLVKFGIECKRVTQTKSTAEFMDIIQQVLMDLKAVCQEVNLDQHAKL